VNPRSLAFRLALWYALLLSVAFALIGTGMFYGLGQYLRASLADSLRRRSAQVVQILAQAPAGASAQAIAESIETRVAPEFNNRFVRVLRAPGGVVYRSGVPADHSFEPAAIALPLVPWPSKSRARQLQSNGSGPIIESLTPLDTASGRYLIELGASLAPAQAFEAHLLGLLGWLLPLLMLCAATGGYLLVGRALRPVDRMAQSAGQMMVRDLDARLPVVRSGDALERLAIALNHLLSRLSDSVQASRRFLADASHELRTPLTLIKGELQQVAGDAATAPELRDRVGSVLEEVARLEHLVSGLLVLSRLDAGETRGDWTELDVAALAAGTAEQMRLMAEDRGIELDTRGLEPAMIRGDRARLKQVIVNLLDNAIRCTPRGGRVALSTRAEPARCLLVVRDSGTGIPAAALPHVFERFYRVDEARSREDGGAGLGLSIVRSILNAHGADIEVQSELGRGSRFRIRFPR
jgi:heavy metal sensor kinase